MVIFVSTLTQGYDIQVKSVHDCNAFVGVEDIHPQVSVICYSDLQPIRHCRAMWDVYGLFLLENEEELLRYGSGRYDYHAGSIVCVVPAQTEGVPDDGATFRLRRWVLLLSPKLSRT